MACRDEPRKWTNEMEAYFIELVTPHKHLWDYTNEFFKKNKLKLVTYDHIRNLMVHRYPVYAPILTNDNLIKKFQNLKGYYKRERKKVRSQEKDMKELNFTSGWVHFERLRFLDEVPTSFTDDPEKQSPQASDNSLSEGFNNEDLDRIVVKSEIIEAEEDPIHDNDKDYVLPKTSTDLCTPLQVNGSPNLCPPLKDNASPVDKDMRSPTPCTDYSAHDSKSPTPRNSDFLKHMDINSVIDSFEKNKETPDDCEASNSCSQSKNRKRKHENGDIQDVIKYSLMSAHDALEKLKQRKETVDSLFADYIGMSLAEIPPSKEKDRAKIEILEILMKLKYSSE